MPKITDYPKVTELVKSNVLLLDGENGTRGILAKDLAKALFSLMTAKEIMDSININDLDRATNLNSADSLLVRTSDGSKKIALEDAVFAMLDPVIDVPTRRCLWRGKKLGSAVTEAQYNEIGTGKFKGIFLGDYWEIGGRIWRVVDFDYWYGCGDNSCVTHHLVIMPDRALYNSKMNESDDTTGAYVNSAMYKTGLEEAKTIVNGAFSEDHILNHREYLQNATTNGYSSAGAWLDSTVELPNEPMMYGSYIFTPAGNGTIVVNRYTIGKSQLAGMRVNPTLINLTMQNRENYWLRDVASTTFFACVTSVVVAAGYKASSNFGVRVVFGLCKENA